MTRTHTRTECLDCVQ